MIQSHGMAKQESLKLELFFSALADRTRLRLLNLMREGEVCVCFFAETLSTNNPKISRHLAYLKRAGLVAARREGKWMHYRISEPKDSKIKGMFQDLLRALRDDKEMKADRKRLISVCCPPSALVSIGRK